MPGAFEAGRGELLRLSGIAKSFGGVQALRAASLSLQPGKVTALIGENGAGKSTLVKLLCGLYQPDDGEIQLDGAPVRIADAEHARRLGINVVHQECLVFDDLSVTENIFVSSRPARHGWLSWHHMRERARSILTELEAPFDPDEPVRNLSVAQKHLVQIARALTTEARVLILDEPTAALSHREVEDLFRIVRNLRDRGCALLFVSHRFEEIFAIADRYTVFRDGRDVAAGELAATNTEALIRLMVGRAVEQLYPKQSTVPGPVVLHVEGLGHEDLFEEVSFDVRRGEILGVYGLVGAGRTELAQALFGLAPADRGRIRIDGQPVQMDSCKTAIQLGLAYVPEDRQQDGAILPFSIRANITLTNLDSLAPKGLCSHDREDALARKWIERLAIRTQGPEQAVAELSGGNQQKVILAKWLARQPRLLILDEPTKGIDVGAKSAVHAVTSEYAAAGNAVVLISSELPEILGMSDRILVMRRGRAQALLDRSVATAENVVQAAVETTPRAGVAGPGAGVAAPSAGGAGPPAGRAGLAADFAPAHRPARATPTRSSQPVTRHNWTLAAVTAGLIAVVSGLFPAFAAPGNLLHVLDDSSILILLALGQMLVILTRGIDLSTAANLALCGMIAALLNRAYPGLGLLPVLVVATTLGGLLGALNGLLVWRLSLPPIVVTLGTLSVFRGSIYLLTQGGWVHDNEMSPAFLNFVRTNLLGLSSLSWLALLAAAGLLLGLRFTSLGRNAFCAGSQPVAAAYCGIDPGRMQFLAYTINGALSGLCGYLWVARFAVAYTDIALGFELQVIAACLIGGVAIAGGVGSVTGVLLGSLFIGVIKNALPLIGISPFWQMGINGTVILGAAILNARQRTERRAILEPEGPASPAVRVAPV